MRLLLLLVLFFIVVPLHMWAQRAWHPEIAVGFSTAQISDVYKERGLNPNAFFVEFSGSLNQKHEQSFSFVKRFGFAIKYNPLSQGSTALGGKDIDSGFYLSSLVNLSLLGQKRIGESYLLQFGPHFEMTLIGYEKLSEEWDSPVFGEPGSGWTSGERETSEFNRNYFRQPYYGITIRLIDEPENKKHPVGIGFSYLLTESTESNFYSKHLLRLAFSLRL